MAPSRRKSSSKSSASAAAAANRQWKVGDLVLAKVKGFPAWPATVSEPEMWGYSKDWKKVLVHFFGTKQIAFCNPADVEAFTEEKKQTLLVKRQGRGADFLRAVREIIDSFDKSKVQEIEDKVNSNHEDLTNCFTLKNPDDNFVTSYSTYSSLMTGNLQLKSDVSMEETNDPDICTENSLGAENIDSFVRRDEFIRGPLPPSHLGRKRSRVAKPQSNVTLKRLCIQKSVAHLPKGDIFCSSSFLGPNESLNSSDACQGADFPTPSHEDNVSETDAFDDETPSCYDDSNVASTCMNGHIESIVECSNDNILCNKLDFMKEVVVTKKTERLDERHMADDAMIYSDRSDAEECPVVQEVKLVENSSHVPSLPSEKRYNEDGDEHLPFFKRARVRMSNTSLVEELKDESVCTDTDEKPNIESGVSLFRNGIVPLHCNVAVSVDDEASEKRCIQQQTSKCNNVATNFERSQYYGLLDNEAVLPPSKRLHRALEAMSANNMENSKILSEESLTDIDAVNECFPKKSGIVTGGKCRVGLEEDACHLGVCASFPNSISPKSKDTDQSEVDVCNKQLLDSKSSSSQLCDDNLTESTSSVDVPDVCRLSPGIPITDTIRHCLNEEKKAFDHTLMPENKMRNNIDQLKHKSVGFPGEHFAEFESLKDAKACSPPLVGGSAELSPESSAIPSPAADSNACAVIMTSTSGLREASQYDVVKGVEGASTLISPMHSKCLKSNAVFDSDGRTSSFPLTSPTILHCDASHTQSEENRVVVSEDGVVIPDLRSNNKLEASIECRNTDSKEMIRSFEAELGMLTRTKESISRATRTAINCANLGIAREVIEIVASNLEKESRLHRKVDLFFLVDSITQSSSCLRGHPGKEYPCLIQSVLPRLLSAAAPSGNAGHENRRQCLKVLRLWVQRKVLPEPVLAHHMQELDMLENSSSAGSYSRRSSRTERAHNDPLRGMEGMLVDEYGSNSSLQLPGLCMPRMLKEDEESDSDGDTFEAVTPERYPEEREAGKVASLPAFKMHRHILADVDVELEMEDVAPPTEEVFQDCSNNTNKPPSPPLLTSPPPPPSVPSHYKFLDKSSQVPPPDTNRIYTGKHTSGDTQMVRDVPESSSISRFPSRSPVDARSDRAEHVPPHSNAYQGRPPNHYMPRQLFPQFPGGERMYRREGQSESHFMRPRFYHGIEGSEVYDERDRMKPNSCEVVGDRWRFASNVADPMHVEKASHVLSPYKALVRGRGRFHNQGWSFPPRRVGRRDFMPMDFTDDVFPASVKGPVSWRPR